MKDALARLEALERGAPADRLLIVTEAQTDAGPRYRLPQGGDLLTLHDVYAKKYYRSASDRTALFNKFIRQCSGVLEAEPTSPARGDAYWNMIAREVAPWATL